MAYNKQNNSERLPKLEYFQVRLKDAVRDGNQDKADYYRSRIAELKAQSSDERISLQVEGLFGSRKTIAEAFEYADLIAKSSESPIHTITPVFVLYNTIAEQYDLVPKAK
jgi:hypothetical protein